MRLPVRLLVAVLSLLVAFPAASQDIARPGELVTWRADVDPEQVAPGEEATLIVTGEIAEGWNLYALDSPAGLPLELTFQTPEGVSVAEELVQEGVQEGYDPNFKQDVRYFIDEARVRTTVTVEEGAPSDPMVRGTARFMICNDRLCLPPTEARFGVQLVLTSTEEAAAPASDLSGATAPLAEEPPVEEPGEEVAMPLDDVPAEAGLPEEAPGEERAEAVTAMEAEDARLLGSGGLWAFLLLAAGAGFAALLTPCVFPMIPLTVSYFTKHADSRREAARMASVYGLTIVGTFTLLGVLAALLLGAAGAQTIAANPWVNLFIGLVFVIFALSLLGLFELRLPTGLLNYFNRQSNEQAGYAGVLFMGLTLTLVSFSCTAPFVGGLLAATTQGSWAYPVVGMAVFSGVFALPFVGFALFPNGLQRLPRSGAWMNVVKVTLGFVELAAALKFLSNADLVWGWGLLSRPLAIALTVVIFFLAGLYLIGKLRLLHEPAVESIGVGRLMAALGFFGLALYLLPGLLGAPLGRIDAYLPPRQATDLSLVATMPQGEVAEEEGWHEDISAAFAQAERVGKPVFIDFTGYTCTNCRQMEANVFPQPAVAQRFEDDFVLLRLYTDDRERGPELQRFQLGLTGTVALPTYAVVAPEGRELLARHSGIASTQQFVDFLDRGASAYRVRTGALALGE